MLSTAEDFYDGLSAPLAAGMDAVLSREDEDDFFELQIVKHHDSKVRTKPGNANSQSLSKG